MKLRQKLAMVLAAAMVVTSVPVVTMAKSTNDVTKVLTVQKDTNIGWSVERDDNDNIKENTLTTSSAVELKIIPDDGLKAGDEFYLELDNAKWAKEDVIELVFGADWEAKTSLKITRNTDKELKVEVLAALDHTNTIKIPMIAEATGGNVTVAIIPEKTTLKGDKFVIALTPEESVKGTVTVGDVPAFYTNGTLAPIKIEEVAPGAFNSMKAYDKYVKITLDHTDFEFVTTGTKTTIEINEDQAKGKEDAQEVIKTEIKAFGTRGLSDEYSSKGEAVTYTAYVDAKDDQVLYIPLPTDMTDSRGVIEFTDIAVKATTRKPEQGELKADIEGASINTRSEVTLGKVIEYGVTLKVKDDKVVKINEGRAGKVTFTLAENVEDSMADGSARTVLFTLENGHFGDHKTDKTGLEIGKIKDADGKVLVEGTDYDFVDVPASGGKISSFEIRFYNTYNNKIDTFTFEDVIIHAPLGNEGEIVLKAEGRAIDSEVETTVVEIVDVVDLESDAMTVKVGLKDQKGGKVVISENEKGIFQKGKQLVFDIEEEEGLTFTGKPEIKVTEGDLLLGGSSIDSKTGKLTVEIKRASKEASTVEITGFGVKVDRTVPQGKYDLSVGGSAITECGGLKVEDFFVVGTPNTEDITNEVKKVVSTFAIGSTEYTVNDVKYTMDAAPYISAESKTMVPVRYVANAFGIAEKDILFSNSTVTILAGHRTIQLTIGSDVAILNGVQYKMATPVVLNKDNRTFVPIAEIAKLLGVHYSWNNELKTVTFNNAN